MGINNKAGKHLPFRLISFISGYPPSLQLNLSFYIGKSTKIYGSPKVSVPLPSPQ